MDEGKRDNTNRKKGEKMTHLEVFQTMDLMAVLDTMLEKCPHDFGLKDICEGENYIDKCLLCWRNALLFEQEVAKNEGN